MIESGGAGAAMKSVGGTGGATALAVCGLSGMAVVCILLVIAVVFMSRMPRSPKEWAVGLISTVVSSLTGGAAVVMRFGLIDWINSTDQIESYIGLMAIGGVVFVCGLPGWFIVRVAFNYITQNDGKGIDEVARDLKKLRDDLQS
jgi:D-arabinose 1-dehydrogenase-like Zn-dependent alcohol dehydrogenase